MQMGYHLRLWELKWCRWVDQCEQKPPLLPLPKHTSAGPHPHPSGDTHHNDNIIIIIIIIMPSLAFKNENYLTFPWDPLFIYHHHHHHYSHWYLHRYSSRSFSCQGQPILWLFWISRYCRLKFLLSPHFHFHEQNWRLKFNLKDIFKSLIVFSFMDWNIYSCFLLIWRSW